jgi:small subunit ribosomal protein S20
MANIKSSKKDILTNARNRKSNVSKRSSIKTLIKKIETLSDEKELNLHLNKIYKELDRVPVSVMHVNKASRLKSQAIRKVRAIIAKTA